MGFSLFDLWKCCNNLYTESHKTGGGGKKEEEEEEEEETNKGVN